MQRQRSDQQNNSTKHHRSNQKQVCLKRFKQASAYDNKIKHQHGNHKQNQNKHQQKANHTHASAYYKI